MSTNRINVLLYIDSLMIGGMHKQTMYLAKYLNKVKFNVIVLTQNTKSGDLRKEFNDSGCKILDLGRDSVPARKKSFNPFLSFSLLRVLKNEQIDIVYLNAAPNLIYFQIAKLFLFRRIVQIGSFRALTFWKGHLKPYYKPLDILFSKLLYNTSKFTIVNSLALSEHYRNIICVKEECPLVIINNGSDFNFQITKSVKEIRQQLNILSNQLFVIMVARLDPWKDFETLLKVAKIVGNQTSEIKFIIMGDGSLRTIIENSIKSLSLSNNVFLIGEKIDSINFINASDISILTTHGEGFSNSIMESMYLGKPVIATNVGGNRDIIGDSNEFGFLVNKQSPNEIVKKIFELFESTELRNKIGNSAKKRIIDMCDIKKYVEKYESLFISAIKN